MDQSAALALSPSPDGDPLLPGPAQETEKPPRGYKERLQAGWCTYSSACPRRADGYPDPTHGHCSVHRVKAQRQKRRYANQTRSELADQGKCRRCRRPSSTYRCPRCKILDGANLPAPAAVGVDAGVDAARDDWRPDNDGWKRYRGKGQRGAPTAATNDGQDLRSAAAELERGRQALIYAQSESVKKLGRIQRRDALDAAASVLDMASRFIGRVVSRNRPPAAGVAELRARVRAALDPIELEDEEIDRLLAAVRP